MDGDRGRTHRTIRRRNRIEYWSWCSCIIDWWSSTGRMTILFDFITISTLGNSQDFGNLTSSLSNHRSQVLREQRFFISGEPLRTDIEFVTLHQQEMQQTLVQICQRNRGGFLNVSSGTRTCVAGGYTAGSPYPDGY